MVEFAISMVRQDKMKSMRAKAEIAAEDRLLDAIVGDTSSEETRQKFRKKLREGSLDDKEVEIKKACVIRLRLLGVMCDTTQITAVGTIKDDFLGLISHPDNQGF